jgi:hypothetical protein
MLGSAGLAASPIESPKTMAAPGGQGGHQRGDLDGADADQEPPQNLEIELYVQAASRDEPGAGE